MFDFALPGYSKRAEYSKAGCKNKVALERFRKIYRMNNRMYSYIHTILDRDNTVPSFQGNKSNWTN